MLRFSLRFLVTTKPNQPAIAAAHVGGWSEQVWASGNFLAQGPEIVSLATARARLLPAQCQIVGWSIANYTLSKNKLIPGGTSTVQRRFAGNNAFSVDVPQAALALNGNLSTLPNRARHLLRGIPDEVVANGEYDPTQSFKNNVQVFCDELNGGNWGTVVRDLSQPFFPVVSIAQQTSPTPITVLVTDGLGGVAAGDYVRFFRVLADDNLPYEGTFRTNVVSGNEIDFKPPINNNRTVTVPNGHFRKDQLVFSLYRNMGAGRVFVRKIGAPFERYRGRRSKRRV